MISDTSPPPPARTAIPALFLLTTIFFLNFFSRIFFSPLLPYLEHALGLGHAEAGFFFFLLSCGYFLSLTGSGFVAARFGHKNTISLSMAGICLALLYLAASQNLFHIRAAVFLIGVAGGLYLPSAIATISQLFPQHRWGKAFGVHELAPNLAFLVAPVFIALTAPSGWRTSTLLLAVAAGLALGCHMVWGRATTVLPAPPDFRLATTLMRKRNFWLMLLLFSLGITGTLGIYSILPTFLVSEHGFDPARANILVGSSRAPTLVTALAAGFAADRIGHRRSIAIVLAATGTATALLALSQQWIVPIIWLQPLVAVCFFPAAFALLSDIGSARARGVIVSLTVPVSFVVGGGLIPSLIALLADLDRFAPAILATGLLILTGTAAVLLLQPSPPNP